MENRFSILIVEDETPIRTGLVELFTFHGYRVESAESGKRGLELSLSASYDLLILDVMLPEIDGFAICNQVRKKNRTQPIIMLTAKSNEDDIINGLALGADDYISKPFSIRELVLRVEAVLRRSKTSKLLNRQLLISHAWEIDTLLLTGTNCLTNSVIELTRREVEILNYLQQNNSRPVSRDELLEEVWGYKNASCVETRTVDIHIAKLRRKIETNPKEPNILLTIRGEGYRLKQ